MQMKNLLRLMGALALTTVATTSVVACGDQTDKQDIKDVKVDDLKTAVDSEKTFGELNTNKEITDAVAAAIKKTTKLDVSVGTDFTLTNDKKKEDKQVAGEVKFTVTAQGDKISGTFTFTDTLTVAKQDIKDVKVDDLKTAVDSEKTFGELNTNKEITDAVAAAIKKTTKLDVSVGTDFTLTNDKKKEDKQVAGEVKFTVTAQGYKISGTFTFTDTLTVAKQDIKDVKVDDIKTAVDSEKTFGELNTNKEITDAVAAAIKKTTKLDVSVGTDFTLTNDKKKEDKQVAGEVKFTVTAQGDKISGTFTFTDTITVAQQDIKDVKVDDLKTAVDSEKTFGELNTNKEITDAVAAAIKKTTKLDVSVGTDFILTNDKKKEDKQVAGEVKFTVTAQGDKISGTFTFTDTIE
ncbi:spiralin repeat-containing protein [Spiroplasma endosymbiont of Zeiraphera isertana]|uniref:spiralin repeat-containing protein n=1 Tax=Spiroplasma endosymbiont of Zeiraphera isertana TaxID=3066313 RepID=UPI00313CD08E